MQAYMRVKGRNGETGIISRKKYGMYEVGQSIRLPEDQSIGKEKITSSTQGVL
jgi:hypothetical protein